MAHDASDGRVMTPGRWPLTVGIVAIISVIAFEAMAVTTAMPVVAEDLGGVSLYGWAFSGFMLANLVGITLGGPLADRVGPVRPGVVGLFLFAGGMVVSGAAPSMPVVVAGRVVAGLGAGGLFSIAYVIIGMGYPEAARARLFAVISSAWVLPSVLGPSVAGYVAGHLSWRLVFFGLLPLMALDAVLLFPALRGLRPAHDDHPPLPVADAVRLAAGSGLALAGIGARSPAGVALVAAGAVVAVNPFRRLVPEGTVLARGPLQAAIALRAMLTFCFFTFDAFLPLVLTDLRGQSPSRAGLALTASGLTWTTGAWIHDRVGARWGRRRSATVGSSVLLAGTVVAASALFGSVPVAIAALGWALAGLGIGISMPTSSLTVLAEAPPGRVGRVSSALQLCDVLGVALGTGLAGASVAFAEASRWSTRDGLLGAAALSALGGVLAVVVSRRLPAGAATAPPAGEAGTVTPTGAEPRAAPTAASGTSGRRS